MSADMATQGAAAATDAPVIVVTGGMGKSSVCAYLVAIARQAGYWVELIDDHGRGSGPLDMVMTGRRGAASLSSTAGPDLVVREWHGDRLSGGSRSDAVLERPPDCVVVMPDAPAPERALTRAGAWPGPALAWVLAQPGADGGDPEPTVRTLTTAQGHPPQVWRAGEDFGFDGDRQQWRWRGRRRRWAGLAYPALRGANQLLNAAAALAALEAIEARLPMSAQAVRQGLALVDLPGRFQVVPGQPLLVVDLAHTPHAASALARSLDQMGFHPRTHAVFQPPRGVDPGLLLTPLRPLVEAWHLVPADDPGSGPPDAGHVLSDQTSPRDGRLPVTIVHRHPDAATALQQALATADPADRLVVFGSYALVEAVLRQGLPRLGAAHLG
ncbi:MAG: glutamate ligase domain-containing protein [Aquabacterium sp.]